MTQEPLWWAQARALAKRGLTPREIAARVGHDRSSIYYAISEKWHDRKLNMMRGKKRPSRKVSAEMRLRAKIVKAAHYEAKRDHKHVDRVLAAWGQPMRRSGTPWTSATC